MVKQTLHRGDAYLSTSSRKQSNIGLGLNAHADCVGHSCYNLDSVRACPDTLCNPIARISLFSTFDFCSTTICIHILKFYLKYLKYLLIMYICLLGCISSRLGYTFVLVFYCTYSRYAVPTLQ